MTIIAYIYYIYNYIHKLVLACILNPYLLIYTGSVMKFAILLLLLSISAQETSSQGKF